jgi:hypothetical protein
MYGNPFVSEDVNKTTSELSSEVFDLLNGIIEILAQEEGSSPNAARMMAAIEIGKNEIVHDFCIDQLGK